MSSSKLRLAILNCSGEEVAVVEAQMLWQLPDLLEALPQQSLFMEQRLLLGQEELQDGRSLGDLGVVDGTTLTRVLARRRCVLVTTENVAQLCCARSGRCLQTFQGHVNTVFSACLSPDEEQAMVLTASKDCSCKLWSTTSGRCIKSFEHPQGVRSAVFSPDAKEVLMGCGNATAALGNVAGRKDKDLRTFIGHECDVLSAVFSPSGQQILTAADEAARLWSVATRECLFALEGHQAKVKCAVFSPDGDFILTGSADFTAKLWSAGSGDLLRTLDGHRSSVSSVSFSPDGSRLLTASFRSGGSAKLWCSTSGACLQTLQPEGCLSSAAFSSDGKEIITAAISGGAHLWCADTGACTRIPYSGFPLSAILSF